MLNEGDKAQNIVFGRGGRMDVDLSLSAPSALVGGLIYLAFGIKQLHTAARAGVGDCIVFIFIIVT